MSGLRAKEIAFDAGASALTSLRNLAIKTAMNAISILAMALVICLFGGYVDSPNDTGLAGQRGRRNVKTTKLKQSNAP